MALIFRSLTNRNKALAIIKTTSHASHNSMVQCQELPQDENTHFCNYIYQPFFSSLSTNAFTNKHFSDTFTGQITGFMSSSNELLRHVVQALLSLTNQRIKQTLTPPASVHCLSTNSRIYFFIWTVMRESQTVFCQVRFFSELSLVITTLHF